MFVGGDGGGVSPEWEGVKVLFLCLLMRGRETEKWTDPERERERERWRQRKREGRQRGRGKHSFEVRMEDLGKVGLIRRLGLTHAHYHVLNR